MGSSCVHGQLQTTGQAWDMQIKDPAHFRQGPLSGSNGTPAGITGTS